MSLENNFDMINAEGFNQELAEQLNEDSIKPLEDKQVEEIDLDNMSLDELIKLRNELEDTKSEEEIDISLSPNDIEKMRKLAENIDNPYYIDESNKNR